MLEMRFPDLVDTVTGGSKRQFLRATTLPYSMKWGFDTDTIVVTLKSKNGGVPIKKCKFNGFPDNDIPTYALQWPALAGKAPFTGNDAPSFQVDRYEFSKTISVDKTMTGKMGTVDFSYSTGADTTEAVDNFIAEMNLKFSDDVLVELMEPEEKWWVGLSLLGDISEITEGPENRSYGVNLTLSGIPLSYAEYLINQKIQGKKVTISMGFLTPDGSMVGSPYPVFVGYADTMDLRVGKETAVSIAVESLLVDWERARTRRFTDPDQRSRFPDDAGFQHVTAMVSKDVKWGRA